jgi:ketosteroid isomerase-like protein
MKKLLQFCIAILFIASQLYAQGESDLKAKFNEMNKKFSQMMVDGDHEALLAWYADDIISMPSYQPMLKGIDALKKAQEMDKNSGTKITAFSIKTIEVMPAGNYFIELGTYTISMEIPGMGLFDDNGKYLNVWEQDGDDWKMKVDIWNTDLNPWAQMEGEQGDDGKQETILKDE